MAWRSSPEAQVGTMWRGHTGKSIFRLVVCIAAAFAVTAVLYQVPKMDKIFDAFFTTKPQGTGMGLAISRSIIESHGGSLWADANPGQGAIFFFTFPHKGEEAA